MLTFSVCDVGRQPSLGLEVPGGEQILLLTVTGALDGGGGGGVSMSHVNFKNLQCRTSLTPRPYSPPPSEKEGGGGV